MIALAKWEGGNKEKFAEECFREALSHLFPMVKDSHPLLVYAYDRIGYTCQAQGRLEEAEQLYLTSLDLSKHSWPPTIWNEVTLLNLAILYGQQGRVELQGTALERVRSMQRVTGNAHREPRLIIPIRFDPECLTAEWQGYAARRLGVSLETVGEFVNGVLLATLLGAAGGAVMCDVQFVLGRELNAGVPRPFTLHAGVEFTYPELQGPIAELALEVREDLSGRALAAAWRLPGLTSEQQGRFHIRYKWAPVDWWEFEEPREIGDPNSGST
jgi:tetratricopeptide (TPR) repeat protein